MNLRTFSFHSNFGSSLCCRNKMSRRTARNGHFAGKWNEQIFFAICSKMEGAEWKKPFSHRERGWLDGPSTFFKEML